ncbi:MAG: hypothetical protein BWK78_01670 [Thiotrichaceae bacterium IS1]|nr:MAG: hypothetical protein BWK78_01670 [Thiotrichaceae bacterium IS1]
MFSRSKATIVKTDGLPTTTSPIGWLLSAVILTAPYLVFHLPDVSFYIVDFILIACLAEIVISLSVRRLQLAQLVKKCSPILGIGILFTTLGMLSSIEGVFLEKTDISLSRLFSVDSQYAFIMIFLPLIVARWVNIEKIWIFFKMVAVSYLVPMLVTVMSLHPNTPWEIQEVIFVYHRAAGTYGNPNAFAGVLAITIPIYWILGTIERGWWRMVGFTGGILIFGCLFLTGSFGSILMFLALLMFNLLWSLIWRYHPARIHLFRNISIGAGLILVFLIALGGLMDTELVQKGPLKNRIDLLMYDTGQADITEYGSAAYRMEINREYLEMIERRIGGLWGHGLGQSMIVTNREHDAHLVYLLLWVEGGLWLLLIYLFFLVILLRNALRLTFLHPTIGMVVCTQIIAIVLFGFVTPHIYMRYYWIPVLPAFINWRTEEVKK